MRIIMSDTYHHCGTYPSYTMAIITRYVGLDVEEIPIIVRQYGPKPNQVIVSTYESKEQAYDVYRIFVDEEQPFVPILDRKLPA